MKSSCFLILIVLVFSVLEGFGQKIPSKKDPDTSITGSWKLDSARNYPAKAGDFYEEDTASREPIIFFYLSSSGKIISFLDDALSVHSYDYLTGKESAYILVYDPDNSSLVRVEQREGKLAAFLNTQGYRHGPTQTILYLSSSPFPFDSVHNGILTGNYYKHVNFEDGYPKGWTIYPPLSAIPEDFTVPEPEMLLHLGEDFRMRNFFGEKADSGTWSFDLKNLTLELNGVMNKSVFDVEMVTGNLLTLHPRDADNDSVIRLSLDVTPGFYYPGGRRYYEYTYLAEEQRMIDSTRAADSIAAEIMFLEESLRYKTWFTGTWKAVSFSDNYPDDITDYKDKLKLNIDTSGKVICLSGKREYRGEWKLAHMYNCLTLSFKGKEQFACINGDEYRGEYSEEYQEQLVITFIVPGSDKVRTYVFVRE